VLWLQQNSDLGPLAAAISNAVRKFRNDGVEHVVIVDERGVLTLLFLNNAQSQHYFPRYGFNSQNGAQTLADAGDVPRQQLVGSMGIGWSPSLDISSAENTDTGPYSNDARRRCLALYKAHGITFADPNAEAGSLDICSSFWFFQNVGNQLRGAVNRDAFMAVVNRLGPFEAAGLFGTRFDADHHDGVSAGRYVAYNDGCGCVRYTSGNIPID
jgi:hypothetical protein